MLSEKLINIWTNKYELWVAGTKQNEMDAWIKYLKEAIYSVCYRRREGRYVALSPIRKDRRGCFIQSDYSRGNSEEIPT